MLERGIIGFEGLNVSCIIGARTHERTAPQPLVIDLRVGSDFQQSAAADALSATVDYTELSRIVIEVASLGQYQLLETLASRILDRLLMNTRIQWAWIRLRKPQAIGEASFGLVELGRGDVS